MLTLIILIWIFWAICRPRYGYWYHRPPMGGWRHHHMGGMHMGGFGGHGVGFGGFGGHVGFGGGRSFGGGHTFGGGAGRGRR